MSSTQGSTDDGFLSARSSVEPDQLGQPQTDDALSAAISLLDLRRSTGPSKLEDATPTKEEAAAAPRSLPPELAVFIQEACLEHRYLRTKDVSTIVERPERLRAVKIGIAAAFARLHPSHTGDALEDAMDRLGFGTERGASKKVLGGGRMEVVRSEARMSLDDAALAMAHPVINRPPEGFVPPPTAPVTPSSSPAKGALPLPKTETLPPLTSYAIQLARWCRDSPSGHGGGRSEVPLHLPQGDLYLCPGSEDAILGALGTCCEAVDSLFTPGNKSKRAFVSVRPPGHHCAESDPMGFCWVNNVAVAAAHAHLKHGVDRVVILDMDLHHGNGTQDIVWKLNENAERQVAAETALLASTNSTPRKNRSPGKPKPSVPASSSSSSDRKPRELRLCYASLHDIFSYPCEDGDPDMVRDASVNLLGGHGQWIANVHLQSWSDEGEFYGRLYDGYREGLLGAAKRFCEETGSEPGKTLVFVSAGFDACEHEGAGMSRHSRNVPVSFYRRFTQDVVEFANRYSDGKIVSVLEGGYSDRALTSATLAHLSGFASSPETDEADASSWWKLEHLLALEKACKAKGGRKPPMGISRSPDEPWLTAAVAHFRVLEPGQTGTATAPSTEQNTPSTAMQLRVRRQKLVETGGEEASPSVAKSRTRAVSGRAPKSVQSTPRAKEQPPPVPPLTEPRAPSLPAMRAFDPRPSPSLVTDTNDGYTTASRELSEPLTDATTTSTHTTTTTTTTTTTDSGASLDADDERASHGSSGSGRAPSSSPEVPLEAGKLPKVKWTWNAGGFDGRNAGPPRDSSDSP